MSQTTAQRVDPAILRMLASPWVLPLPPIPPVAKQGSHEPAGQARQRQALSVEQVVQDIEVGAQENFGEQLERKELALLHPIRIRMNKEIADAPGIVQTEASRLTEFASMPTNRVDIIDRMRRTAHGARRT